MMNRTIWCFWTGDNDITPNRARNLESMKKILGNVQLVSNKNLEDYIVPKDPIPDAYWNLSYTHRADFLRFYFMYHYGGLIQQKSTRKRVFLLANDVFRSRGK